MTKTRLVAAVLLALVLLGGCSAQTEYPAELLPSSVTAPPTGPSEDENIEVELYFASADSRELLLETRTVLCPPGQSRAFTAVKALCEGPQANTLHQPLPDGWVLERVAVCGDVCHIYFSGPDAQSQRDVLIARAALAQTVYANEGVSYTDVFLNDMQPGFSAQPLGVMSPLENSLDSYILQITQQASQPNETDSIWDTRDVGLFFADPSKKMLLCDVRTISYERGTDNSLLIEAVFGELLKGPVGSAGREPVLPASTRLLRSLYIADESPTPADISGIEQAEVTQPDLTLSQAEQSGILVLYVLEAQSGMQQHELELVYASLAYTMGSFVPGMRELEVNIVSRNILNEKVELQTQLSVIQRYISSSIVLNMAEHKTLLGRTVLVYLPARDGLDLTPVSRNLAQEEADDPLARVRSLFYSETGDEGIALDFLLPEDVLSVSRIEKDMMVINFREGFCEKLKAFVLNGDSRLPTNTRVQMSVFSIINTLGRFEGVNRVWLLEEGQLITQDIGYFHMGNALLCNPGLMGE